jgi:hypothetical protein
MFKDLIFIFVITSIYEGMRILGAGGPKRHALISLLGGVLLVVMYVSISMYFPNKLQNLSKGLVSAPYSELSSDWGKDLTPELREKYSQTRASWIYTGSGKLANYIDRMGEKKQYCPTEQDISVRDQAVATHTKLDDTVEDLQRMKFTWLDLLLFAAMFGWVEGRRSARNSK